MRIYFPITGSLFIMTSLVFSGSGCVPSKPTDRIEFTAPDSYPEGVTNDGKDYYVSSARTGTIGRVSPAGQYTVIHEDSALKSTYGMKVHPDGTRLYVCAGDANYSKFTSPDTRHKMARLIILDLSTGRRLHDIDLAALIPGKHFPNDLAFDDKGNCYITDSYAHAIYKITDNGRASVFAKSQLFATEGIGLNGIVYHPGGFLLADNTNTGAIYKIDINDPAKVQKVKINQFFLGADGLLWRDSSSLVVVVNGNNDKIYELTSTDSWTTAEIKATTLLAERFSYPATATLFQDNIWIMNAKFNELVDSNAVPSKTFAIQRAIPKPIPKKLRK